ncbi:MAG: C1 family peptidase [Planctomycetes bacterium]|nr:C1 family peptidase [Planctomycetota bacterium]
MAKKQPSRVKLKERNLDVRPDTVDFRDRMFVPTLTEVPVELDIEKYKKRKVPILDQGTEGSCTGFGLATVCNYLLRTRRVTPSRAQVSPRMLYEMAKRYDEWPGEEYSGSSPRGAMKGWHKHGVCSARLWKHEPGQVDRELTPGRSDDAADRPLGAYFRVNHKDLVAMHCALAEVGVLYAAAIVHAGWDNVKPNGEIPLRARIESGHAFAIVAYDERGFWIQNSWGTDWGLGGFAKITYEDWLEYGRDVWVARLGVPLDLGTARATAAVNADAATETAGYTFHNLRPHVISIGNDGRFRQNGTYATSEESVRLMLEQDFPRITENWQTKRVLLYAHGGLTSEKSAVQRIAEYRGALLDAEIYPLAFVWKSDFWMTLVNILRDAFARRRTEGLLDATKDFMLDRLDDALEPLARYLGGKMQWDEMKENAMMATTDTTSGGAYLLAQKLADLVSEDPSIELHVAGHSAGGIFHAPLVQLLTGNGQIQSGPMEGSVGLGLKIKTCTLWAPACTVDLFKQTYRPAIEDEEAIGKFSLFTLTNPAERDDHCANIYHKSLLYLVSNAFEKEPHVPWIQDGVPILGMEKFINRDPVLKGLFDNGAADWIRAPNTEPLGTPDHSGAQHHGDFDDDAGTLQATLARILDVPSMSVEPTRHWSASAMRDWRHAMTRDR